MAVTHYKDFLYDDTQMEENQLYTFDVGHGKIELCAE
jgi:hypothetical protein